jgi:ATP-dependent RNA helicase DOB1
MDFDDELFDVFSEKPTTAAASTATPDTSNRKRKRQSQVQDDTAITSSAASASASASSSAAAAGSANQSDTKSSATKRSKISDATSDTANNVDDAGNNSFGAYVEQRVHTVRTLEKDGCLTVRCYPPGFDAETARQLEEKEQPLPDKPAKTYPFTLDPFQREAVACLERNQSVLVAAHTSAGKTVVAEYAIALSLRDNQRVIYTSPIKALSNQKYRELQEEFEDVGLMTGDVTINPSAGCLVMTTEILRNMLYRGSEVMREVAWVVFDEVHYMRDPNRGVVWEETLIMLPHKVRYVFLSATIPNSTEFALWIAKLHNQPCDVVYTDFRPTPLQHYLFPSGGDGIYMVVDEKGTFKEQNFQKALSYINQDTINDEINAVINKKKKKRRGGKNPKAAAADIYKIVNMIMKNNYSPVIVFSFSRRETETNAMAMAKLDFTDDTEKGLIRQIFKNAMESLSDDDRKLPQIENMVSLLTRGIGIHHGGLLPILKEVIEVLFGESLLKILFTTETFAMGLNMPARTVVFTSCRKFDGTDMRLVNSGEYIQMSGRAGRRGLDDRGIVIQMVDEKLEPASAKDMIMGQAESLNSAFHLGYNMLLNLMRVDGADPEYLMARSFHQFQTNRQAPQLQAQLDTLEAEIKQNPVENEDQVREYHYIRSQLERLRHTMADTIRTPINALPFLNPGRMVQVKDGDIEWGYGAVIKFHKKRVQNGASAASAAAGGDSTTTAYIIDVLLGCDSKMVKLHKKDKNIPLKPSKDAENRSRSTTWMIVPVNLSCITQLSKVRIHMPPSLAKPQRKATGRSIVEVLRRFPDGMPLLDPIEDMKINDDGFVKVVRQVESLEDQLTSHPLHKDKHAAKILGQYSKHMELNSEAADLRTKIRNVSRDLAMMTTLKSMKRVLRRLGLASDEGVITVKGRVACEISTCDELLVTELMFSGMFNELSAEQVVAVLSTLVFEERPEKKKSIIRDELQGPFRQLQESARRVANAQKDARLPVDVEEYVAKFQPQMMEVVFAWCTGAKFADIMTMTSAFEGSIIRGMRRLEEVLRQLAAASKSFGNAELEKKFAVGITKIKRDIIFAASLYL